MRKLKLSALVLALVMLLAACGGGGNNGNTANNESNGGNDAEVADSGEVRDTLTIATQSDAGTLDPIIQNSIYEEHIIKQIYDGLVARLPNGELDYRLAESIEQPDELTYVINLREGVQFSNGEPLTSEDVKFTLERAAASDGYAYMFDKIDPESYDTTDPNVISFKLKEPDASFEQALAHPCVLIVNKKAVEEAGDNYGEEPVGTGPFMLESWNKLDSINLVYNENYWGEKPDFDKMVFRIIPEGNNRLIELESGQVDMALEIPPSDIQRVEDNEDLEIHRTLDNSVQFIGMNVTEPPFDKLEARQAMNYAIDVQAIIDTVQEGTGVLATGPINPNFDYSISEELEPIEYNPEKAKELLEEAGVEEGTKIDLYTSDDTQWIDISTIVQAQLKEVGLDVEITSLEWGTYMEAIKNKEDNMFIMGWTPSVVDPHYTLYSPYHSANMGVGPNFMYYSDPELDELIEEGIRLPNGDERAEVYKKAQELIMEDLPVVFTRYGEQIVGTQSYVENYEVDPSGSGEYYHVKIN